MARETRTLELPEVDLVYDVIGRAPARAGQPVLVTAGHPMTADGFAALAEQITDRTVVTYDPRGLGRSLRKDGRHDRTPTQHADDLHALIGELGVGPVDVFGSSGGAVNALCLVERHPADVRTLVAHEPPLLMVLPDAAAALAAERGVQEAYRERGFGAGMAAFIALTAWQGEFTEEYAARPAPDPAHFGLPTDDDGSRDDPLLSGTANAITSHPLDGAALRAATTRIVIGGGVESRGTLAWRAAAATAADLGLPLTDFPSHHGGFLGAESGYGGDPAAFAARLLEVLEALGEE